MKIFQAITPRIIKNVILTGLFEFGPVIIFLIAFELFHVYKATIVLMIVTIISTVVTYRMQKRLPYVALYIALLTSIFGYITLTKHEPRFIQMRDTLYDVTSALTLIVGLLFNVHFLKIAFHNIIPMTDKAWKQLTYFWIGFFLLIATANEYVRRYMSLRDWFDFKSSMILVTIISGCLAFYYIYEKED